MVDVQDILPRERCAGRLIYLMRHAAVDVAPETPPRAWRLSQQGRSDALALARSESWSGVGAIWSSGEAKAQETAQIISAEIGVRTAVEEALGELRFDAGYLSKADFELRVGNYLEGADDVDFEPYAEARDRIVSCISDLCLRTEGHLAVVSHGRIITVLLSHLLNRRLGRREWGEIGFPDLTVLNLETRMVSRGFATLW